MSVVASVEDEANCCSLAEDPSLTIPAPASLPEGEVGTAGKVLAVGGENGSLSLVDLAGRTVISRAVLGSAVNSCCHLAEGRVVAGLQDGRAVEYGGADLTRAKGEWHDSTSPVLCTRGGLPSALGETLEPCNS